MMAYKVLLLLGGACVSGASPGTTTVNVPGVAEFISNVLHDGTVESLGIPFAAAPVGQNRFKPPAPPSYGVSPLNATTYGSACPQAPKPGIGDTSEDCLTLNIWSPLAAKKQLLPVFFWIHGGGWVQGSGKLYNGSRLADLGVVAVSINYRLGALGWFASAEIANENPNAPGNGGVHGFLDQVAALRWVRANIQAFGGNKKEITIAGESAGSLSVCAHLHLPISKDLFQRATMESGSCVAGSPWGAWNATDMQDLSKSIAISMNATDLASLRHVPTADFLKSPRFFHPSADGWYMKHNPSDLPVSTKGIEIIIGSNSMDTLYAPPYLGTIPSLKDLTPKTPSELKTLVIEYFGDGISDVYPSPAANASEDAVAKQFWRIHSDVCNTCPKHFAAQKFLGADQIVFAYEFAYAREPLKGLACHGCELSDVFNLTVVNGQVLEGSYDPHLGDTMSRYWASFVRSGFKSHTIANPSWPEYRGSIDLAMSLDITTGDYGKPQISSRRGLNAKSCVFFNSFVKSSEKRKQAYIDFCVNPAPRRAAPTAVIV